MPIRYFIKQLLLPPGILLLLLALAWWFRRSRPRLAAVCFALGFGLIRRGAPISRRVSALSASAMQPAWPRLRACRC